MKRILLLSLLIIPLAGLYAQTTYTSEKDVFDAKEIIFYGYDFSDFKLAETKRLNEDLTKYVFSWIGFCQEHMTGEKLSAWLRKDNVISNYEPTVEQAKKIKPDDIVAFAKHNISKDSLQQFISRYELKEKEGIGLVMIVECFEKVTKRTSGYFIFFDIASKRILNSEYISSKEADGYRLTNYWGIGLVGTTKNYFAVYRNKLKNLK